MNTTTSPQIAPAGAVAYEIHLDRQLTRAFRRLYHLQLMQAAKSLPILLGENENTQNEPISIGETRPSRAPLPGDPRKERVTTDEGCGDRGSQSIGNPFKLSTLAARQSGGSGPLWNM